MSTIDAVKSASEFIFDKNHQLFLNFIDHTDQAQHAIQYIEQMIPDITSKVKAKVSLEYLDVGCGYGYKTRAIHQAIKKHHAVNTVAIDPSSELLTIFKKSTKDKNIKLECNSWENYEVKQPFDFISSIHTFYYINDWQAAINKMLTALNNEGTICLVIRSNDEICQFKNNFFKKLFGESRRERHFEELCQLVKRMNVKYKTHIVQSHLNIKDCLDNNEKGKKLIEFLLRLPYSDIPPRIQEEIHEYIYADQHDGYLIQEDGFMWIST